MSKYKKKSSKSSLWLLATLLGFTGTLSSCADEPGTLAECISLGLVLLKADQTGTYCFERDDAYYCVTKHYDYDQRK